MPTKPSLLNAQFIAILCATLGAVLRVAYGIVVLVSGSAFEYQYYIEQNFSQVVLRLLKGLSFPLIALCYTIQVLMWLDVLFKRRAESQRWIWITFAVCMVVLFGLEITTAFMRTYTNNSTSILFVYRVIMAFYCLLIVILSAVFGVKFYLIRQKDANGSRASSPRAAASKKNLGRLVLITSLTFFVGIVILAIMASVPITSVAAFYVPESVGQVCQFFLSAAILFVFFSMMKSRMGKIERGTTIECNETNEIDERSAQLEAPLIDPSLLDDEEEVDSESDDF